MMLWLLNITTLSKWWDCIIFIGLNIKQFLTNETVNVDIIDIGTVLYTPSF